MKKNKDEPEDKAALRLKEFLDAREPVDQPEETGEDLVEKKPEEKDINPNKKPKRKKGPKNKT